MQCTAIFSLRRMPNERTVYRAIRESKNKVSIMHNPSEFHFKVFHDLLTNKFIICPDIVRCQATNLTWLNITFIFFILFILFFPHFNIRIQTFMNGNGKGKMAQYHGHFMTKFGYGTIIVPFFGTFWQYIRRDWSCQ